MGVSGCGKTTLGRALAVRWSVPFLDADTFHSPQARHSMSRGRPLSDTDRWPWLDRVAAGIKEQPTRRPAACVVACSALKRAYRDRLERVGPICWVHPVGTVDLLKGRLERRAAIGRHFMPPGLLTSQLETLEPLGPSEWGVEVPLAEPVQVQADHVAEVLGTG